MFYILAQIGNVIHLSKRNHKTKCNSTDKTCDLFIFASQFDSLTLYYCDNVNLKKKYKVLIHKTQKQIYNKRKTKAK